MNASPIRRMFQCRDGTTVEYELPTDLPSAKNQDDARRRLGGLTQRRLVREDPHYNCVGLVLCNRRGWMGDLVPLDTIQTSSITTLDTVALKVLRADGWYRLDAGRQPRAGDLAIYQRSGAIEHVGIVLAVDVLTKVPKVLSKFGCYGEYEHDLSDVPDEFGEFHSYWSFGVLH